MERKQLINNTASVTPQGTFHRKTTSFNVTSRAKEFAFNRKAHHRVCSTDQVAVPRKHVKYIGMGLEENVMETVEDIPTMVQNSLETCNSLKQTIKNCMPVDCDRDNQRRKDPKRIVPAINFVSNHIYIKK